MALSKGVCGSWPDLDGIGESGASRAAKAEPAEASCVGGAGVLDEKCTPARCVADMGMDIAFAGRSRGGDRHLSDARQRCSDSSPCRW